VKKLIAALTLIVLVCCSSLASANPYYAHDEPHEQWADFWYNINPVILPLILALFGCIAGAIFLFWLNRTKTKPEAAKP
jgi:hypothetical protein